MMELLNNYNGMDGSDMLNAAKAAGRRVVAVGGERAFRRCCSALRSIPTI